jgi:hypothetical protein
MTDLQRLIRAAKVISRVAWKYKAEEVAKPLMEHCTQRERDDVYFAGQWCVDLFDLNRKADEEALTKCCECGDKILYRKDKARTDSKYCSAKCRQAAYRKRHGVTPRRRTATSKRNETEIRDGSTLDGLGLAVTKEDRERAVALMNLRIAAAIAEKSE